MAETVTLNVRYTETHKGGPDTWQLETFDIQHDRPTPGTLIEVPGPRGTYQTLIACNCESGHKTCKGCYFHREHVGEKGKRYVIQCHNIPCSGIIYEQIENVAEDML
jgi:hypothetical protein